MIKIKWKENRNSDFEFYSEIPVDYIKRRTGLIKPHNYSINKIFFRFLPEGVTADNVIDENEYTILNTDGNHNYYLEGGLLMTFHLIHPVALLEHRNFTHFKIDNNEWMPIENIEFGINNLCIASLEKNIFTVLGEISTKANVTTEQEIQDYNFLKREPNDLYSEIKIVNVAMW